MRLVSSRMASYSCQGEAVSANDLTKVKSPTITHILIHRSTIAQRLSSMEDERDVEP